MSSLREHIELQQQQQQQAGADSVGVRLGDAPPTPRWRLNPRLAPVLVIAGLAMVATVATLAILAPGWRASDASHVARHEEEVGGPNPHYAADAPAMLRGPATLRQMVSGLMPMLEEKLQEAREHRHQEYKEEAVSLGHEDLEVSVPRASHHHPRNVAVNTQPDPHFTQETVVLQAPTEHKEKQQETKLEVAEKENSAESSEEEQEVTKEEPVKNDSDQQEATQVKVVKESSRLASTQLASGVRVCETPECAVAATQISESLDLSVDPCDNFYQFACGGWMAKHPIPESGATGTFYETGDILDQRLTLILNSPAAPSDPLPLHMFRDHYTSCMDTDTMDGLGLAPLVDKLNMQGGWPMTMDSWDGSAFNLPQAINYLRSINMYPIIAVGVDVDYTNTSRRLMYIDDGSVPLGWNPDSPSSIIDRYRDFMAGAAMEVIAVTGAQVTLEEVKAQVEEVIAFEYEYKKLTGSAEYGFSDVGSIQQELDNGVEGQFDLMAFLRDMFSATDVTITEQDPVIAIQGTFFADLTRLLQDTPPRTVANFLGWSWVYYLAATESTYAMRNLTAAFHGSVAPRDIHCLYQTNIDLGFALSRAYVDEFFPASAKEETTELVEDIRSAFNTLLDVNEWMLPDDLVVAREKLAAIDPFVAYPDWIMDDVELTEGYEGLDIIEGQQLDNLARIGQWYSVNSLAVLRDPPMHSFLFPPTVVNAFYNPPENTITILAGILETPFYAHNSLAALNYGGIGMVIGHEMTHGFDNSGRLFDKDGNFVQWWSDATVEAYEHRAQCFVDQYGAFLPPELAAVGINKTLDGVQTEGENIADNGGIREAYKAYQLYVERYGEEPRLPGLDEFTPDHLFYLGFANVWCEHKNADAVLAQLAVDPHSPGRFRVLGPLSNDQEFSRVWNCPAGAPMNRGDESCLLW